jgi:hypothetical protein
MHIGTGGSSTPKHHVRTAVVYDSSGRVIHTHHVVTFAGGTAMDDDQIRARALKFAEDLAGSRRTISGKLETILVDGHALLPGTTYTVDTKRRELVPGRRYAIRGKTTG